LEKMREGLIWWDLKLVPRGGSQGDDGMGLKKRGMANVFLMAGEWSNGWREVLWGRGWRKGG
jgi:hypothetical protein